MKHISILNDDKFTKLAYELAQHVEGGMNFLHVEASEILAFVVMDSERSYSVGIPPHLPIAYGLKGNSLPVSVMCYIINDIRNDLKEQNTGVLCEVYDRQFHQIIVKSEGEEPLTRLQHVQQIFKNIMTSYDRKELLMKLLIYSDILQDDLEKIAPMNFRNGHTKELDGVCIYMRKVLKNKKVWKRIYIETIDVNGIQMSNILTSHRKEIWEWYLKSESKKKYK